MKQKKIAAVTGATGAIGKAIAELIAKTPNYKVVLICRNEDKARKAVDQIKKSSGNPDISYRIADLSRHESIKELANQWDSPLHALVNNAAITPKNRLETPEGIEMQFATNILGYFWMINEFTDRLKRSAPSRIVNVASYWAGDLDLSDLEFKNKRYNNNTAYRQSKQADRMLTAVFAEKLKSLGITVNSCHPGDVNSKLSNDLGFGGHQSPYDGAATPVYLAISPECEGKTGLYYENRSVSKCRFASDKEACKKLYELCLSYQFI